MLPPVDSLSSEAPIRVLIAEDSLVIGNLLRFNMEQAGFDTTLAVNGKEAIDQLEQSAFDILVTDYEMPILNGEQLCSHIRNELRIPNLPIIMCSAKCLELDAEHLRIACGVDRLLQKPFSITELIAVIRVLVHSRSRCGTAIPS